MRKSKSINSTDNKFFRIAKWSILGLAGFLFLAIFLLNTFFFSQVVDWSLSRIYKKNKIKIEYTKTSGNLFTGKINFDGLRITRSNNDYTNFDLTIKQVELNIHYFSFINKPIRFKYVTAENVRGEMIRVKPKPWSLRKKNNFIIDSFSVRDAKLKLTSQYLKTEKKSIDVVIKQGEASPLRRKYVLLDLFFKSNLQGTINNHTVKITSKRDNGSRHTEWKIENLDVATLRVIVNRRLRWLKSGILFIDVDNTWKRDTASVFDSRWRFRISNPVAEIPENTSRLKALLLKPVVKYLNSDKDKYDLSFTLKLEDQQFKGHASLDAANLWKSVFTGLTKRMAGSSITGIKEKYKNYKGKLKGLVN